jgi:hypothetical protein
MVASTVLARRLPGLVHQRHVRIGALRHLPLRGLGHHDQPALVHDVELPPAAGVAEQERCVVPAVDRPEPDHRVFAIAENLVVGVAPMIQRAQRARVGIIGITHGKAGHLRVDGLVDVFALASPLGEHDHPGLFR